MERDGNHGCNEGDSVEEPQVAETIERGLVRYFKEHLNVDVTPDTPLIEEQVIDSMGVMELISYLQETFDVELDMEDLTIENFESIRRISELVVSKRDGS